MIINRYHVSMAFIAIALSNTAFAEEQLADPTMPANYKHKVLSEGQSQTSETIPYEWVLNSTIVSPYRKIAVINGQQFRVGEEVNGAKIIRIAHQRVILSYKNKPVELLLQRSFISQVKAAQRK